MTVARVVLGDRLGDGNIGLHVSLPGVDALTADTSDPTQFAFSTDWGRTLRVVAAGSVLCNTWVSLPIDPGYMPYIVWRKWDGDIDVGYFHGWYHTTFSTYLMAGTAYFIKFQTVSGVRQFMISNVVFDSYSTDDTQEFFYFITNLSLDP